jgi:hypothetical protein
MTLCPNSSSELTGAHIPRYSLCSSYTFYTVATMLMPFNTWENEVDRQSMPSWGILGSCGIPKGSRFPLLLPLEERGKHLGGVWKK